MATISIQSSATWEELVTEISQKTGVRSDYDLKYGYPPQEFNTESIDGKVKLADLPLKLNGEQLIIVPRKVQQNLTHPMKATPPASKVFSALPPQDSKSAPSHNFGDLPNQQPLSLTRKSKGNIADEPPEVRVPALEGIMVLRIMPDDNSCLFRALSSAVLGTDLDGMVELRSVVAQTIQAQPDLYTKGLLEKEPKAYCEWIQRTDSWGGGIELSILSQHFNIEICSINVQDLRIDRFNEGRSTRCVLVYSGIHYDVCAVCAHSGAQPELDRKVFDVLRAGDEEIDGGALEGALELCKTLQRRHYYTDTHGFTVKCNACGQNGTGQAWAVQHAKSTGHGDFGEA